MFWKCENEKFNFFHKVSCYNEDVYERLLYFEYNEVLWNPPEWSRFFAISTQFNDFDLDNSKLQSLRI